MGAPTWPAGPDEQGAELSDEEAEEALLAPFLFGEPPRLGADGAVLGTSLDAVARPLVGWLRMVTGLDFALAIADPPATDGQNLYLPAALPGPPSPGEDALIFRIMGLVQLGIRASGLLQSRGLLVEIHGDWVLRSCVHLLAARAVIRRLVVPWPGLAADFLAIQLLERARALRVNHTPVPRAGLPPAFEVLLAGLSEDRAPPPATDEASAAARRAVSAIQALPPAILGTPAALSLAVLGNAQTLRQALRAARLGPPPLPFFLGVLRPEWMLDASSRDLQAENAWKEGPAPLRLLRDLARKRGPLARLGQSLRGPDPAEAPRWEQAARPALPDPEARRWDEWDEARRGWRAGAARVVEQDASPGPLESCARLRAALSVELGEVRRRFAALVTEQRWRHGCEDGPEIDVSRAVAALADIQAGHSPPRPDWYQRFARARRELAVLVLVDLSGSVQGDTLALEQEALVLLAEGLGVLRLPHALYGFGSYGAEDCRLSRVKDWREGPGEAVDRRLGNLRPGGGTRLGAFVRHAAWRLAQQPQERRLLLLLSDGHPEDRDGYRGPGAVRDAALAVAEARRQGVFVHNTSLQTRERPEDARQLVEIFGVHHNRLRRAEDLPRHLPALLAALIR